MAVNGVTDVGNNSFAQPDNEIEAHRGEQAEGDGDEKQPEKVAVDARCALGQQPGVYQVTYRNG